MRGSVCSGLYNSGLNISMCVTTSPVAPGCDGSVAVLSRLLAVAWRRGRAWESVGEEWHARDQAMLSPATLLDALPNTARVRGGSPARKVGAALR